MACQIVLNDVLVIADDLADAGAAMRFIAAEYHYKFATVREALRTSDTFADLSAGLTFTIEAQ